MKYMWLVPVFLLVTSCEDSKKTAHPNKSETEKVSKKIQDTVAQANATAPVEKEKKPPLQALTNDSVAAFLTQYGTENPETKATIETSLGTIVVQLYDDTPLHRANFVYMAKNGYLSTTMFHRVVPGFVVQGGNSDRRSTALMRKDMGSYTLPAEIKHKNIRGALAAAKEYRANQDNRSSPFEFYIVQNSKGAHHLNTDYTVFGKVLSGMDVVDKIAQLETDEGDWPLHNMGMTVVVE